MSSKWTSKYAIMRDLSLAQGCEVPVDLEGTVAADEKPPALNILEETEEAFFEHCVGDGDNQTAPDFVLIQQMLEMISHKNGLTDSEDESDRVVQIIKPPTMHLDAGEASPSKINSKLNNNHIKSNKKIKKKRQNVAVNSILEAQAADKLVQSEAAMNTAEKEPVKLLKPNDFVSTDKDIVESLEKVNGWLDSQKENQNKSNFISWEPGSMFKRKNGCATKSTDSDSVTTSPTQNTSTVKTTTAYKPSTMADEYYKKYLERSKFKESVKEDIWTRAERIMKEIDSKKKLETVEASQVETTQLGRSEDVDKIIEDKVRLTLHRHLLTHECLVCEAIEKNAVEVNLQVINSDEFDTCPLLAFGKHKS